MVARITTDIFCDVCGNWTHGPVSHKVEKRLARKLVKRQGWTTHRNPDTGELEDLCPKCRKD